MRRSEWRSDIQGIRAIAVLAVMLFHLNNEWLPGGYIGVDIFLVISGYLITSQLIQRRMSEEYESSSSLMEFYVDRIKRIVPAYAFMLILTTIVVGIIFTHSDYVDYLNSLEAATQFISNRYYANYGDYFAPVQAEQPLLHTWSLAIEMQFYLLLPALVLLMPVRALRWVVPILTLTMTVVAEWQLQIGRENQAIYYALYARIPEFLIGSWLALRQKNNSNDDRSYQNAGFILGFTLIVISLTTLNSKTAYPGLLALLPVVGTALLIATPRSSFNKVLTGRFIVWLGFLSYSLYLWHWPVLASIRYYTAQTNLSFSATIFFIILTFSTACISYYFVENPMRHLQRKGYRRFGIVLASTVVVLVGIHKAASAARNLQDFSPLPVVYTRYANPEIICHGKDNGQCVKGDLDSTHEVLVIGDSHAAMLNNLFDFVGKNHHFRARILTASNCVPIPNFNISKLQSYAREPCSQQIARVQRYVERAHTIIVAGSWSYQIQDPNFLDEFADFLRNQTGKRVYVLSQVPLLHGNPMRAHRLALLKLPYEVSIDPVYALANSAIADVARRHRASFISGDEIDLFKNAPFYGGKLIYFDQSHLNEIGVENYAVAMDKIFNELDLGTQSELVHRSLQSAGMN
ncbi:MAG: acyltransferase family protein [Burkholderiaceae bacterium]